MEMCRVPQGTYRIGATQQRGFTEDKEMPSIDVQLNDYQIGATPVTNAQFAQFVATTGYVTDAERLGWSLVFGYFLEEKVKAMSQQVANGWWYVVPHASWRCPEGEGSSIAERMNHPVVQVSRNDAIAYCQWAKLRLPSEAEWEVAAKGGTLFDYCPWGEELVVDGVHRCNVWQGEFPTHNTQEDGYTNTAPVYHYEPNGYGCYQMIGNVWEWCSNPARIDLALFGHMDGQMIWNSYQSRDDREYAIKGGSFLCHASYCRRYRIAARHASRGMQATNHLGFRCVKD